MNERHLILNALERRVLDAHRDDPDHLFDTAELVRNMQTHPDALRRARNKLWRAGLIAIGCRGKSQLKSEVQDDGVPPDGPTGR
ncbi:MAG: hypothetical protein QOF36_2626 [Microbacteriaceae bacterium]|nr:hypothetical protein [Microbacteriaceae bacterium]